MKPRLCLYNFWQLQWQGNIGFTKATKCTSHSWYLCQFQWKQRWWLPPGMLGLYFILSSCCTTLVLSNILHSNSDFPKHILSYFPVSQGEVAVGKHDTGESFVKLPEADLSHSLIGTLLPIDIFPVVKFFQYEDMPLIFIKLNSLFTLCIKV